MAKGTKRASPGADDEKDPLQAVELDEENAQKLNDIQRETQRVELHVGKCGVLPRRSLVNIFANGRHTFSQAARTCLC